MSQLLLSRTTSNLLNRVITIHHHSTTTISNTTNTIIKNTFLHNTHPALPLLKLSPQIPNQIRTYYHRKNLYKTYTTRISNNGSKLYARRMLYLASLSASNMVRKTKLESGFVPKPSEWSTVDLAKQRKEFGESISSLGSTQLSRVWAAGELYEYDVLWYVCYLCERVMRELWESCERVVRELWVRFWHVKFDQCIVCSLVDWFSFEFFFVHSWMQYIVN